MDFGFIYFPNREISRAAMGSGCLFFVLFILLPLASFILFVPLYLIVFVLSAADKFQSKYTLQTLLLPLLPFAVACVLCALFWWLIPGVVNLIASFLCIFKSMFINSNALFTPYQDIPDGRCLLYFIAVFGGCLGSILSVMSIETILNDKPLNENKKDHYDRLHDPKYKRANNTFQYPKYQSTFIEQTNYPSRNKMDDDTVKWLERHRRKTSKKKQ